MHAELERGLTSGRLHSSGRRKRHPCRGLASKIAPEFYEPSSPSQDVLLMGLCVLTLALAHDIQAVDQLIHCHVFVVSSWRDPVSVYQTFFFKESWPRLGGWSPNFGSYIV